MKGRRLRALGLALLGVVLGMLVSIGPPVSAHTLYINAPSIVSLATDGTLTINITAYTSGSSPNYWAYEICETPGCGVWSSSISYTSTGQTTASVTGHTNWNQGKALYVRTRAQVNHSNNPWGYSHSSSTGFVYVPLTLSFSTTDSSGSLTYNIQVQAAYKVTFWICTRASSTQSSAYCGSTTKTTSTPVGTNTKDMSAVALPGGGTFDPTEYYYFYIQAETSAGYKTAIVGKPYYQDQRLCTPEISPPVDLGTLGTGKGLTLPSAGTYQGNIKRSRTLAVCSDSDGHHSQYFSFTLDEGGGVWFKAESDSSLSNYLRPDIRVLPSMDGTPVYENAISDGNQAVLGAVLDDGTYLAQVRPTLAGQYGGGYDFTIKRIYPETTSIIFSSNSFQVTYDFGAYTPNMEASIEYKPGAGTTWTTINATASNDEVGGVKKRYVTETMDNLTANAHYNLRAKFKYAGASQYTTTSGVTLGYVAFPAPTRPSLGDPTYNEPGTPFSVLIMANWLYPQVEMTGGGNGSNWGWVVEWDGQTVTSGSKSLRSATSFYQQDIGRTVKVRVQGVFDCQDDGDSTDEPCLVYIAGYHNLSNVEDRYEIPEGETWYTAWSENNVFTVQADHLEVPTAIEPETDPLPGIVEAIDSILAAIGVSPESRRPEVWAFFLCFSLAIGSGFGGFAITGGTKRFFWAATFGGFIFFLVFVMAGPAWFGIPTVFAYATLVVPLMMVAFSAIGSVRT